MLRCGALHRTRCAAIDRVDHAHDVDLGEVGRVGVRVRVRVRLRVRVRVRGRVGVRTASTLLKCSWKSSQEIQKVPSSPKVTPSVLSAW